MASLHETRGARLLLYFSAVALILTALMRAWFTSNAGGGHSSLGLWGLEVCANGCAGVRWDNTRVGDEVYIAGYLAVAASFVTAALALFLAYVRTPSAMLLKRTRQAALITLGAMAAFFAFTFVFDGLRGLSPNWALFVGPAAAFGVYRVVR